MERLKISALYPEAKGRRVIIMRHGERVDEVDPQWVEKSFKTGKYERYNLNMPLTAPFRAENLIDSKIDWSADPGLSTIGHWTASLMGMKLSKLKVQIDQVFCSPAMRCVQTASRVIEGYESLPHAVNLKIQIEQGLYEWGYGRGYPLPRFVEPKLLAEGGTPIDIYYKSAISSNDISPEETYADFNRRSFNVMDAIVKQMFRKSSALIVTHAPLFDAFNLFIGKSPKNLEDWCTRVQRTPHLFMITYEETRKGKWCPIKPPIGTFCHAENGKFSYKMLKKL
ncbi:hypothetical protein M514_03120, partial [Trichuris suis]